MSDNIIAERIKSAREALGITKTEASRRLQLSKIGYCRYEYGERTPSIQMLQVIAQCFNTSVDYLTGKTDDMSPEFIVISKEKDPELFCILEECQSPDSQMLNRLLSYYRQISD